MAQKILIVDDDFNDLETMRISLEREKYDVNTADNGADVIDLIIKSKPDLVIIDIKMPTFSGYDLLRILREKLDNKIKIIFITIIPKAQVDLKYIDGFVQKPFMPAHLIKEVNRVLK